MPEEHTDLDQPATGPPDDTVVDDEGGQSAAASAPGPPEMSAREEAALRRVRAVSRLLDEAIRVPGTNFRIGVDPILGILPVAGDAVAAAVSLYPVAEAYRLGAPMPMLAKMLALVAIDASIGSVPLLGPLFDAVWKANTWNRRALERYIRRPSR